MKHFQTKSPSAATSATTSPSSSPCCLRNDRLERIAERLRLQDEEDLQFVIDLISATFTRGIEFGAVEVTAQQIELGQAIAPAPIEIAHVDLP